MTLLEFLALNPRRKVTIETVAANLTGSLYLNIRVDSASSLCNITMWRNCTPDLPALEVCLFNLNTMLMTQEAL